MRQQLVGKKATYSEIKQTKQLLSKIYHDSENYDDDYLTELQ